MSRSPASWDQLRHVRRGSDNPPQLGAQVGRFKECYGPQIVPTTVARLGIGVQRLEELVKGKVRGQSFIRARRIGVDDFCSLVRLDTPFTQFVVGQAKGTFVSNDVGLESGVRARKLST